MEQKKEIIILPKKLQKEIMKFFLKTSILKNTRLNQEHK